MRGPLRFSPETLFAALLFVAAVTVGTSVVAGPVDVRILVDVSGSMKANDPRNLRIPAVRLVAELMPAEAIAGVWLFSETVEPLIAAQPVDAQWKQSALQATNKIHSRGQFTNIEAALNSAVADWLSDPGKSNDRHVILLTDGVVDVSKDVSESDASRQRILTDQIDRIKSTGATIHTIALSQNSDRELLTALAARTEGWAEQVDDADSLQRVFLHMFEQAAKPDSVPLIGNKFDVDGSISEMTLLVFRGDRNEPLKLVTPSGETLSQAAPGTGVRWREENGYELVTVESPAAGGWRINTQPDPDNRVLIVTDLKLQLGDLPAALLAEEAIPVRVRVTEGGEQVVREDFLKLIKASLAVTTTGASTPNGAPLSYDPTHFEFYDERLVDWPPGHYEFVIRLDGGTFRREQRAKIRIHGAPFGLSSHISADGQSIDVLVEAAADLVSVDTLSGLLVVSKPDGSNAVFDLPPFVENQSELSFEAPLNGAYRIEARLLGQSTSDRLLNVKMTPSVAEITLGSDARAHSEEAVLPEPVPVTIDWMQSSMIVAAGNVAMFSLLGIVWFVVGRRRRNAGAEVVVQ